MSEGLEKAVMVARETAADWVVRLSADDCDLAQRQAFFTWLRSSPLHLKEYLQAEAAWRALDAPMKNDRSDVRDLLSERPSNVVEMLFAERAATRSVEDRPGMRRFKFSIAAALGALAVGLTLAVFLMNRFETHTYRTDVGELRRVVLADGSVVELNTKSRMQVDFSDTGREVILDEGEAFFEVAKDPARPFIVKSGDTIARAVGTQFNVYRQRDRTVVTVVDGKVAVTDNSRPAPTTVELSAGRSIVVAATSSQTIQAAAVTPRAATAWRQRRLIFDQTPLGEVIAEFNRYNRQQLAIDDAELASQFISGVFDADKPMALVRFLAQQSGIRSEQHSDATLLIRPAGKVF